MQDRIDDDKIAVFRAGMSRLAIHWAACLTQERLEVYWERLQRYSKDELAKALEEALDNEAFFPTIAAIRKYIEPLVDPGNRRVKYPRLG
jgi:hypothetical protein